MSLLRVCLLLLVLPTPTLAQTTTTDDEPVRHPSFSAPLPARVVEVAGGGGGFVTSCPTCRVPFVSTEPSLLLSLRWGITDNVQLSLPAILTGSLDLMGGPRLSVQAGLTGIGYSFGGGVFSSFIVGAGSHFIGRRSQLAFGVLANASYLGSDERQRGLSTRAGFAFALTPDLLVGSAVAVDVQRLDVAPEGVLVTFTAGASGPYSGVAAPLVRWWVLPWLSADLWPFLTAATEFHDDGTVVRAVTAGANVGLTLTL